MKKLKRVLAVAMLPLLLAGCTMKMDYGMTITEDDDVKFELIYAYDKAMVDGMISLEAMGDDSIDTDNITDEQRWKYIDKDNENDDDEKDSDSFNIKGITKDATSKRYDKTGWYGYVYTVKLGTLKDLSKKEADERTNIFSDDFLEKPLFIKKGNNYKSNMTIKFNADDKKNMDDVKGYGAMLDLTVTVNLPKKAISSNAKTVSGDGKTLTWDLTEEQDIEFEFEGKKENKIFKDSDSDINWTIVAIVAGALGLGFIIVLAVIIIVAVVVLKKKKANKAE